MPDASHRRQPHAQWVDVGVWTATAVSRLLATYAIAQGLTVIVYGPDRWLTSPALQAALELPGRTTTWGAVLLLAGLVGLFGSVTRRMHLTALGHALAGMWSMFFAVSMTPALLPGSGGPTTGVFVYGAEAAIFLTLAYGAWRLR